MGFFDKHTDNEDHKDEKTNDNPSTFERVDWESMDEETFERLSIQKEMGKVDELDLEPDTNYSDDSFEDDYSDDDGYTETESSADNPQNALQGSLNKLKGFKNTFKKKKAPAKKTYTEPTDADSYGEEHEESTYVESDDDDTGFSYSDLNTDYEEDNDSSEYSEAEQAVEEPKQKTTSRFKGLLGKSKAKRKPKNKVESKQQPEVTATSETEKGDLDSLSEEELRGMSLDELEKLYEKSPDAPDVEDLSDLASQRSLNKRYERLKARDEQRLAVLKEKRKAKVKRVMNGLFALVVFTFLFSFVYYTYSDFINAGLEAIWIEVGNFFGTLFNADIRDRLFDFSFSEIDFDFNLDFLSGGADIDILE